VEEEDFLLDLVEWGMMMVIILAYFLDDDEYDQSVDN
jgi:hypothetical protein